MIIQAIQPCLDVPYRWRGRTPEEGLDCWGATRHGLWLGWKIFRASYAVDVGTLDPTDAIQRVARRERTSGLWLPLPCEIQPFRPSEPTRGGDVLVLRVRDHPVHMCLMVDSRKMIQTAPDEYSRLVDWERDSFGQLVYRIIEHWRPIELCDV